MVKINNLETNAEMVFDNITFIDFYGDATDDYSCAWTVLLNGEQGEKELDELCKALQLDKEKEFKESEIKKSVE